MGIMLRLKLKRCIILFVVICLLSFSTYAYESSIDKLEIIQMDMSDKDKERYILSENNFGYYIEVNLTGYKKLYRVNISLYYDMKIQKYKNLVNEEYETLDRVKVYDNSKYLEDVELSEASKLLGEVDLREYLERVKIQSIIPQITGVYYKGVYDLLENNEIVSNNSKFVITDYNFEYDKTINDFCIVGFYGYFLTK